MMRHIPIIRRIFAPPKGKRAHAHQTRQRLARHRQDAYMREEAAESLAAFSCLRGLKKSCLPFLLNGEKGGFVRQ